MLMKKIVYILFAAAALLCSCGKWLDVDPGMGVDDTYVFGSYRNIKAYLDWVSVQGLSESNIYQSFALYEEEAGQKFALTNTTDATDGGRLNTSTTGYKRCNLTWDMVAKRNDDVSVKPISQAMWQVIRVANRTLEHLPDITDCTEDERDALYGYCYFYRAYAHFVLCRKWGGVPYLEKALGADDDWDLPRLSGYETYQKCAEDFQTAYEYLKKVGRMRSDPGPGKEGHLNVDTDIDIYPTGIRALAFRARTLVYAASPLNNQKGNADWEAAASACAEALTAALENGYSLVPLSNYRDLFLGVRRTEETFWVYNAKCKDNAADMQGHLAYPQNAKSGTSGACPTQNFVDLFETKWGDPLDTEQARQEAEALGHYDPQDPYRNIDPRMDFAIVHDGTPNALATGGEIKIYKNTKGTWPKTSINGKNCEFGIEWGTKDNVTNGFSNTGYYSNRYWDGNSAAQSASHYHNDNLFRLAELYLLYAEAVNEAYGPSGRAGSVSLTAVDAVNVIRNRVEMPNVLSKFTGDKETFRKRIQNERLVEFSFEDYHYWCDTRRWMILPQRMSTTLMGMYIEECTAEQKAMTKPDGSKMYPNGKVYTRKAIPQSRQCTWKDCMYYFPFSQEQTQTMVNFKNNPLWQ